MSEKHFPSHPGDRPDPAGRREPAARPEPAESDPTAAFVEYDTRHVLGDAAARMRAYRPAGWKRAAAWCAIAVGVVMLVGGAGLSEEVPADDAVKNWLTSLLFFAAFALPGGFWLYANRRDSRRVAAWARARDEYSTNWQLLTADEQALFTRPDEELPLLPKRPWAVIWVLVFALVVLAGALAPTAAG